MAHTAQQRLRCAVGALGVMQASYRLPDDALAQLVRDVADGCVFGRAALRAHAPGTVQPIAITRFEDGREMIRDGLHRATAILLARPSGKLLPEEYTVESMTYEMFGRPNVETGFLTPFDPRTEVRAADFGSFLDDARRCVASRGDLLGLIAARRDEYVRPRQRFHESLAEFCRACCPSLAPLASHAAR